MARICAVCLAAMLVVAGCENTANEDLYTFMEEARQQGSAPIEPLPEAGDFQPFFYGADSLRSPFAFPRIATDQRAIGERVPAPDLERRKEYLERFTYGALKMVGIIEQKDVIWALIRDGDGQFHRVGVGSYMGTSNGRIRRINHDSLELSEVVPDGPIYWVRRTRVIQLEEAEENF